MKLTRELCVLVLFGWVAVLESVAGTPRATTRFSTVWDVGPGRAVFVVGSHPELGSWNPARALRLQWSSGNAWSANVSLPEGTDALYKFISKPIDANGFCASSAVIWSPGPDLALSVPFPGGPRGKDIFYRSGLDDVWLHYRAGDAWRSVPMQIAGPGRSAGEKLYRRDDVGAVGQDVEFVFRGTQNGQEVWDKPSTLTPYSSERNYYTPADEIWVQDGQVFNYEPPVQVGGSVIESVFITSSQAGIPSRRVRVYLPRGYQQNLAKHYPVIYMHDGQAVFPPGGDFGSWNADGNANREIGQGRMRETILVAIDNDGQNRVWEYLPPGDSLAFRSGRANAYANYLINNVKPFIDTRYRTLTGRAHTAVLGSSMGGLVSAYLAVETTAFKHAGVMSPAFTHSPNYTQTLRNRTKRDVRFYLDWGTAENDGFGGDYWNPPASVYDALVGRGYALSGELVAQVDCGGGHNEAAWDARLPQAFRFLMDIREENRAAPPPPPPSPPVTPSITITNPATPLSVSDTTSWVDLSGIAVATNANVLMWSNSLTGVSRVAPFATNWSFRDIPLAAGANTIRVSSAQGALGWDGAGQPDYNDGFQNGDNGGAGLGAWILSTSGSSGVFVANRSDQSNLDIGERAWGLWANNSQTVRAVRPFSQPVSTHARIQFAFENHFVGNGRSVGWALENAAGEPLLEWYFTGGETMYTVHDAAGARSSGMGWTSSGQDVQLELLTGQGYRLIVNGVSATGTLLSRADDAPARLAFWNWSAGAGGDYNVYVGDITVLASPVTSRASATMTIIRQSQSAGAARLERSPTLAGAMVDSQTIQLTWSSEIGERFAVDFSHNLREGFVPTVYTDLPATPPVNVLEFPQPDGSGFYRIRLLE